MNFLSQFFPWGVLAGAALFLIAMMLPPADPDGEMRVNDFAKLPVVKEGRVKPMGTVAKNSLLITSSRQSFKDSNGDMQPAIKWLLDTMVSNRLFKQDKALTYEVFRIENDQVQSFFELQHKPLFNRYSIDELSPKFEKFQDQVEVAKRTEAKERPLFDQKILELHSHLGVFLELANLQEPLMVPPSPESKDWKSLAAALVEARDSGHIDPNAESLLTMLAAYSKHDVKKFNSELDAYQKRVGELIPNDAGKAETETFFNNFEPFDCCMYLYVVVFILACLAWMGWSAPLNRAAFWLMGLTLVIHTWALYTRIVLSGRPPVTNLYSSAVFIGWGCVGLALLLETLFPYGIGNAVGAVLGAATMLIAHHIGSSGDTLEMMEAVLDTNFWLATHVTIVTFGYVATFVAGKLGVAFILLGVATPWLKRDLYAILGKMIYGVLCFATLLSFTGTVLGGIWADQSWGRFWGWDPKENGAVLIVIWNALILHARWAGIVKQRGVAVLAVMGNMVTAWSWFGTNQLGVGLHAYGFNNTLAQGLLVYWITMGGFVILGLLPPKMWWSLNVPPEPLESLRGPRTRDGLPPIRSGKGSTRIKPA
jgi:ABC-type transport system involved in cytochrome c biogenesis permease subunit